MEEEGLDQVSIRLANVDDSGRISELSEQLGYSATKEDVELRLKEIQRNEHHVVYVAGLLERGVVGWVHVYICEKVVTNLQAIVAALVVDKGHHQSGIGRLLMRQVELWARQKGCWAVCLNSNVVRREAHGFFEHIGFSNLKTQLVFRKIL